MGIFLMKIPLRSDTITEILIYTLCKKQQPRKTNCMLTSAIERNVCVPKIYMLKPNPQCDDI